MTRARSFAWALACFCGCSPVDDVVFDGSVAELLLEPTRVKEGAGALEITVRLRAPLSSSLRANYESVALEAQDGCQSPDFAASSGSVSFAPGTTEAHIALWILDDDLAELDEAFSIRLENAVGATLRGLTEIPVTIEDDDRSGIVDARAEFGVEPGRATDQSSALQAALDQAQMLGRGVVKLAAGDYEVLAVEQHAGTTLSGRGARLHRPAKAPDDALTVSTTHHGSADSPRTLIEGLTIDGRRDFQRDYRAKIGENAHLIQLHGEPSQAGRLRVNVESVELEEGTGSGVYVGPNSDVVMCQVHGNDLYRDLLTLRGGNSRIDGRALIANSAIGTSGMWFSGDPEGYSASRRVEVVLTDTRLASGDLELELTSGSTLAITRLEMARGPLRLVAPDASVHIADSLLQFGLPSAAHNYIGLPHDVRITRSTLVVGETNDEGAPASEAKRTLSAADVRWDLDEELAGALRVASGAHRLLLESCTFQRGADVDSDDTVFGVHSAGSSGSVVVLAPTLGAGIVNALNPECAGCSSSP
jgi:hypothetical protein